MLGHLAVATKVGHIMWVSGYLFLCIISYPGCLVPKPLCGPRDRIGPLIVSQACRLRRLRAQGENRSTDCIPGMSSGGTKGPGRE